MYYKSLKKLISLILLLTLMSGCDGSNDAGLSGSSSDEAMTEEVISYQYKLNTKVSKDFIRLFWDFNNDVAYYKLTIKENEEELSIIELEKNELEYIDYNVQPTVIYSYELSSYSEDNTLVGLSVVTAHINESKSLHSDEAI